VGQWSRRWRWLELAPAAGLVAWLALASSSVAGTALPAEDKLLAVASAAVAADSLQPLRDIEAQSIVAAEGRAVRIGDALTLALGGGTRTFQDRSECRTESEEARCELYRLVAYFHQRGLILVAHFFYEDLKFILIDVRSGLEVELDGPPVFSPSGKFVLVLVNDTDVGSTIQMWERTEDGLSLAWQGAPEDGYAVYRLTDWPEDNALAIEATAWDYDSGTDTTTSMTLVHRDEHWVLMPR
jgi:hypothetical protein